MEITFHSAYRLAKRYRELKINARRLCKDVLFITAGIFAAAFGLKGFILPNGFTDGGATGIALLTSQVSGIPLYLLIIAVNVPFVFIGSRVLGRNFAIKTAIAIAGLSLCVGVVQFPEVTQDKLLVALFGGFFLGAGIGLTVRGGAVIDGTEVLAIYAGRKIGATIGDIILIINILIFSAAAWLLNIETALYAMITYLAASKTLDFIVEGIEEYIGVTIISNHSEEMRQMIIERLGRGVTIYKGERGYGKKGQSRKEVDIIYTVITRLELSKVKTEIEKIEPDAFVIMNSIKDTRGGMIKRRPLAH
ncbi:MAG: YitT family protein [Bacteroidia bacterium]|nr:YitT family protein [Bacteroidia bacterium]